MLASEKVGITAYTRGHVGDDRRFMLFDLDYRGHHAGYIQHLVRYWCEHDLPGQLDVVVTQKFVQQHRNVVALATGAERQNVRFVAITPEDEATLVDSSKLEYSFKGRLIRAFQEWKVLQKYTAMLGTTHCFLMYLDTILLRLAVGSKLPCPFSALYFRPILHYDVFPEYVPVGKERLWQRRDRVCLSRLLGSPRLHTLFCLDPFAVDYINRVYKTTKAAHLADPVKIYDRVQTTPEELKRSLGIDPQRRVFLLFGAFAARKGAHQLLDAVRQLSPEHCQQLCLLVVGTINAEEKQFFESSIADISASLPIQVVQQHRFVPDEEIQPYFHLADVVLTPYQRHIGMSAILVRAAAAHKPVLSSNFGLMGGVVRRYQLGLAVDSTVPAELAKGIEHCLTENLETVGDRDLMQQFADQNAADRFADKIFQCLQSV